eukprot:TRINITY_DN10606_c0_g1_i1.p1 TRINITY_DN10606_c0_g1~~TRINITY_DN10606_c0_g1_i1.p1  ORF type:complete len:2430 (+),score=473.52 TRINITY_DN10606_c0_g1_i1:534-7292(+)
MSDINPFAELTAKILSIFKKDQDASQKETPQNAMRNDLAAYQKGRDPMNGVISNQHEGSYQGYRVQKGIGSKRDIEHTILNKQIERFIEKPSDDPKYAVNLLYQLQIQLDKGHGFGFQSSDNDEADGLLSSQTTTIEHNITSERFPIATAKDVPDWALKEVHGLLSGLHGKEVDHLPDFKDEHYQAILANPELISSLPANQQLHILHAIFERNKQDLSEENEKILESLDQHLIESDSREPPLADPSQAEIATLRDDLKSLLENLPNFTQPPQQGDSPLQTTSGGSRKSQTSRDSSSNIEKSETQEQLQMTNESGDGNILKQIRGTETDESQKNIDVAPSSEWLESLRQFISTYGDALSKVRRLMVKKDSKESHDSMNAKAAAALGLYPTSEAFLEELESFFEAVDDVVSCDSDTEQETESPEEDNQSTEFPSSARSRTRKALDPHLLTQPRSSQEKRVMKARNYKALFSIDEFQKLTEEQKRRLFNIRIIPNWQTHVGGIMNQLDDLMQQSESSQLKKSTSKTPPSRIGVSSKVEDYFANAGDEDQSLDIVQLIGESHWAAPYVRLKIEETVGVEHALCIVITGKSWEDIRLMTWTSALSSAIENTHDSLTIVQADIARIESDSKKILGKVQDLQRQRLEALDQVPQLTQNLETISIEKKRTMDILQKHPNPTDLENIMASERLRILEYEYLKTSNNLQAKASLVTESEQLFEMLNEKLDQIECRRQDYRLNMLNLNNTLKDLKQMMMAAVKAESAEKQKRMQTIFGKRPTLTNSTVLHSSLADLFSGGLRRSPEASTPQNSTHPSSPDQEGKSIGDLPIPTPSSPGMVDLEETDEVVPILPVVTRGRTASVASISTQSSGIHFDFSDGDEEDYENVDSDDQSAGGGSNGMNSKSTSNQEDLSSAFGSNYDLARKSGAPETQLDSNQYILEDQMPSDASASLTQTVSQTEDSLQEQTTDSNANESNDPRITAFRNSRSSVASVFSSIRRISTDLTPGAKLPRRTSEANDGPSIHDLGSINALINQQPIPQESDESELQSQKDISSQIALEPRPIAVTEQKDAPADDLQPPIIESDLPTRRASNQEQSLPTDQTASNDAKATEPEAQKTKKKTQKVTEKKSNLGAKQAQEGSISRSVSQSLRPDNAAGDSNVAEVTTSKKSGKGTGGSSKIKKNTSSVSLDKLATDGPQETALQEKAEEETTQPANPPQPQQPPVPPPPPPLTAESVWQEWIPMIESLILTSIVKFIQQCKDRELLTAIRVELQKYMATKMSDRKIRSRLLTIRALIDIQLGDLNSILSDLTSAIDSDSQNETALLERARINVQRGKWEAGLDDISKIMKFNNKNSYAILLRAEVHERKGRYANALNDYEESTRLDPTNAVAQVKKGQFFEKQGKPEKALQSYTMAIKIEPTLLMAYLSRGKYYFNTNMVAKALADADEAIKVDPENTEARCLHGQILAKSGDYSLALSDFSAAIKIDPSYSQAFFFRGCLVRLRHIRQALSDLSVCILLDPRFGPAYLIRGLVYQSRNMFAAALDDYMKCTTIADNITAAYVNAGAIMLNQMKRPTEAISLFNKAIEKDSRYVRGYLCRAEAYVQTGRNFASAIKDYSRAIHLYPTNPGYFMYRSRCLVNESEANLAARDLISAFILNPGLLAQSSSTARAKMQAILQSKELPMATLRQLAAVAALGELLPEKKDDDFSYELLVATGIGKANSADYKGAIEDFNQAHKLRTNDPVLYLNRGICYKSLNDYGKAIEDLTQAIYFDSRVANAYFERAECKFISNYGDKGLSDYTRAINIDSGLVPALLKRAIIHEMQGNFMKAISDYDNIIDYNPKHIRALINRGVMKIKLVAPEDAMVDFRAAVAVDQSQYLAYFNLGVAQQMVSDTMGALRSFSISLLINPSHANAWKNRGLIYWGMRKYAAALSDFTQSCILAPEDGELQLVLAQAYHKLRKVNEAVSLYNFAIRHSKMSVAALLGRAQALSDLGDAMSFRQALRDYSRVLHMNPNHMDAHMCLAHAFQSRGYQTNAWRRYSFAIGIEPNYIPAIQGRAVVSLSLNNFFGALMDITRALEIAPLSTYPELLTNRGVLQKISGDRRSAVADFNTAIKINSVYGPAYFNLGNIYFEDRDWEAALQQYDSSIMYNPEEPSAYVNRGIVKAALGDLEGGLVDFNTAIELDPRQGNFYFNRGNLLARMNRIQDAESNYDTALKFLPRDALIYLRRGNVYGSQLRIRDAMRDFSSALQLDPDINLRI